MNGIAALQMSAMVVPGGATPCITNRRRPKGGVVKPISRAISTITPNQIRSNP